LLRVAVESRWRGIARSSPDEREEASAFALADGIVVGVVAVVTTMAAAEIGTPLVVPSDDSSPSSS
jgi:hypothetical protein